MRTGEACEIVFKQIRNNFFVSWKSPIILWLISWFKYELNHYAWRIGLSVLLHPKPKVHKISVLEHPCCISLIRCLSKSVRTFIHACLVHSVRRCHVCIGASNSYMQYWLCKFLFWGVIGWLPWSTQHNVWFHVLLMRSIEEWLNFVMTQRNCFWFVWEDFFLASC